MEQEQDQDQDGFQDGFSRTPMSSSSSNVSGTRALKITIESESPLEAALAEAMAVPSEPLPTGDMDAGAGAEAPDSLAPVTEEAPQIVVAAAPEIDELPAAPLVDEPVSVPTEPVHVEPAPSVEETASAEAPEEPQFVVTATQPNRTIEELREAVRESVAETAAKRERATVLIDEMSRNFGTMMDDARQDAALIGRKLMEFVQASFQNNVDLARDYAGARSVPEIVNVHTAYVRRQIELLGRQAEEFRALTNDLAAKKADKLQARKKA